MPNQQQNSQPDRSERRKAARRRSRLYTLTKVLFIVFFLIFIGSVGSLALRTYQDWHDAQVFAGLNQLITEPSIPDGTQPSETIPGTTEQIPGESTPGESEPVMETEKQILPRYQTVYGMNQDMYGWIAIDGIPFSYPVMFTPEDEEYYLRRGFDGAYARSGVPFIDADCNDGCGNYVIYGHNMTNGTMFAQLLAYEDESFWEEHPVIRFDTLYEMGEYEVIAAFYSRVYYKYETNKFRFYEYTDLTDPDDFSKYVGEVFDLALYDTNVDVRYGDELITLITCSYEHRIENERFVVVARKRTQ